MTWERLKTFKPKASEIPNETFDQSYLRVERAQTQRVELEGAVLLCFAPQKKKVPGFSFAFLLLFTMFLILSNLSCRFGLDNVE